MDNLKEYEDNDIIGTDMSSLDENINNGYMMLEFSPHEDFDRNKKYRVFRYFSDDEKHMVSLNGELAVNAYVSFNELVEYYEEDKDYFNTFADTEKHISFANPDFRDLLNLADDMNMYGKI